MSKAAIHSLSARSPDAAVPLAHQALLRREHDSDDEKTQVAVIADEAHQYYVSDFVLPYFTGVRKHRAGFNIFSQSLDNSPPTDVNIFMSTAAHLISFGVGFKDAQRLAQDIAMPRDQHMVRGAERDLYGTYGPIQYWGIGEQTQHMTSLLMNQHIRELFWRVRSAKRVDLYLAKTANVPKVSVSQEQEDAFRAESSRHHAPA